MELHQGTAAAEVADRRFEKVMRTGSKEPIQGTVA